MLLVFLTLKTYLKISFSKQTDCSLTIGFSDPIGSQDFGDLILGKKSVPVPNLIADSIKDC